MDKRTGGRIIADYSKLPHGSSGGAYLKAFIRLRPSEENGTGPLSYFLEESNKLTIKDGREPMPTEHQFTFHRVFENDTPQDEVFREVAGGMASHAFRGFNACCFAYGQTGSGKTHTMIGPGGGDPKGSECGIIPRAAKAIFEEAASRGPFADASIAVSLCEIYCDRIRDLGKAYGARPASSLSPTRGSSSLGNSMGSTKDTGATARMRTSDLAVRANSERHGFGASDPRGVAALYQAESLELHEDSKGNVYVKDLTTLPVHSVDEVLQVIETGFKLRATHETRMNATSSRSHTIFTFHVSQKDRGTGQATISQVHFVDLAGSERLGKSESSGQRLAEAQFINLSLTCLGKVVVSLQTMDPSDGPASSHIPYRDSKLTRLLQNSLGGNAYTTLVATVHPRASDLEESVSTLQFANRCQTVLNRPRVNYLFPGAEDVAVRLRQLEAELAVTKHHAIKYKLTAALRTMRLLAEAGVNGALLPDGKFMTVQGIVVGVTEEEAAAHPYVARALALLAPEPSEEDAQLYKEGQETKAKLIAEVLAAGASRGNKGLARSNTGPGGAPIGAPLTDDALHQAVSMAIGGMATANGIIGAAAAGGQKKPKTSQGSRPSSQAAQAQGQAGGPPSSSGATPVSSLPSTPGAAAAHMTAPLSQPTASAPTAQGGAAASMPAAYTPGAAIVQSLEPQALAQSLSSAHQGQGGSFAPQAGGFTPQAGGFTPQASMVTGGHEQMGFAQAQVQHAAPGTAAAFAMPHAHGMPPRSVSEGSSHHMPTAVTSPSRMALAQHQRDGSNGVLGHRPLLGGGGAPGAGTPMQQHVSMQQFGAPSTGAGGGGGVFSPTPMYGGGAPTAAQDAGMYQARPAFQAQPGPGAAPYLGAQATSPGSVRPCISAPVPAGANPALSVTSLPSGRANPLTTGQAKAGLSPAEYAMAAAMPASEAAPPANATVLTSVAMSGAPIGGGTSHGLGGQPGGRLGAVLQSREGLTPEVAQAEIAKLKNRVHELKKELDEARVTARKEQQWMLGQEKAARSAGERAQREAAEAVRQAKETSTKAADEHARQVSFMLRTTNYMVTEQDRLAAAVPKSLVPYLLGLTAVGKDQDLSSGVQPNTREAAAQAMQALDLPLSQYGVARPLTPATSRRAKAVAAAESAAVVLHQATIADPTLVPLASAPTLEELRHAYAEAVAKLKEAHSQSMQQVQQEHMAVFESTRQQHEAMLTELRTMLSSATHEIHALQGQIYVLQSKVHGLDELNKQTHAFSEEGALGIPLQKGSHPSPGYASRAGSARPSTAASTSSSTRMPSRVEPTPVPSATVMMMSHGSMPAAGQAAAAAMTAGAAPRGSGATAARASTAVPGSRSGLLPQTADVPSAAASIVNGRLNPGVAKGMLAQALGTIGPASHGPKPGGKLTPGEAASALAQTTMRAQATFDLEEASKRGIGGTAGMSPKMRNGPGVTRVTAVAPSGYGGERSAQASYAGTARSNFGTGSLDSMQGGPGGFMAVQGEPTAFRPLAAPDSPSKAFTSAFQAVPVTGRAAEQKSLVSHASMGSVSASSSLQH